MAVVLFISHVMSLYIIGCSVISLHSYFLLIHFVSIQMNNIISFVHFYCCLDAVVLSVLLLNVVTVVTVLV